MNSSLIAGASVAAGAAPQALRTSAPNNTNKASTLKRVFIFFFSFRIFYSAL
jgi:hypothetical protein